MSKFIFDGPTLSILCDGAAVVNGVFTFTTAELYNEWQAWVLQGDNLKYQPALRMTGGDPIGGAVSIGSYLFIRNDLGWHGHPPNTGNITVIIDGNLYPEDPEAMWFDPWAGVTTVIQMRNSALAQAVSTSGTPAPTAEQNAAAVWSQPTATLPAGGIGEWLYKKALTVPKFLGLK